MGFNEDYFKEISEELFPTGRTVSYIFSPSTLTRLSLDDNLFKGRVSYSTKANHFMPGDISGLNYIILVEYDKLLEQRVDPHLFSIVDRENISFSRVANRINKTIYPKVGFSVGGLVRGLLR